MARTRIKRKGDSYIKDALILCGITVILALILVLVFNMTKKPIDKASEEGKKVAYKSVFTEYGDIDIKADDELSAKIADYMKNEPAVKINEGVKVLDSAGKTIGTAYIAAAKGYGGDVTVSVGIDDEGVITGVDIVSMNETAGLGANCTNDEFKGQYKGKKGTLEVTKSGNAAEDEINAISGATITSKAVTAAVNACLTFDETLNQ